MELSSIQHIEPSQLSDFKPDIFIASLGHESRSTHVSRLLKNLKCRKVALESSTCIKDFSYEANREFLEKENFEIVKVESDIPQIESIFGFFGGKDVGIAIDCTNMPPAWYHRFLSWFDENQHFQGVVRLRIIYTIANFVNLEGAHKVKEIKSILHSDTKSTANKKKALVLGLGQEKNIGASILKMMNPDLLYLYYADPPADKKFVEHCFINNHGLINNTPIKNLISYPIHNGQSIYQSLINTILPLRNDYSIIIIAHGPKIFSLVAMLIHLGYPDVRISYPSFKKAPVADRSPLGEPVILDVLFEGEE